MSQSTISCVVPTLNSAATLHATLLSLRSQQGINLGVIVADSNSTDGTLEICRLWEAPTIYVPPGSMYRAINAGLKQCNSEWLAYLNSDDLLYPDSFARLTAIGEETDADVVYGNGDYTDEQGRFVYSFSAAKPAELLPLFRLRQMGFAQPSAIFRRRFFEQLNGFDETLVYRADADFYLRGLLMGKKYVKLDGPSVSCFRLHSKQLSNRSNELTDIEADKVFGRKELNARFSDRLAPLTWKFRNLPHYAIRILRESLLSSRIRLPRTIETYTHK
ncbi:MAG TPA: glycosyltransferase [Blastocatellia bacterium]|nr:glycosyltransferase [Blastocatellia bacterium]HMX25786.1 glycosyltransferase [Blastocatellia bacterium]HMY71805.1 glycosyltransferase [Blastocatellia bacterium]HMZ19504.1 glycosyltransferase [Blastocatellia bacterium]HNG33307.1 glycosyltransferase [Blastocatellia bacterium]